MDGDHGSRSFWHATDEQKSALAALARLVARSEAGRARGILSYCPDGPIGGHEMKTLRDPSVLKVEPDFSIFERVGAFDDYNRVLDIA